MMRILVIRAIVLPPMFNGMEFSQLMHGLLNAHVCLNALV